MNFLQTRNSLSEDDFSSNFKDVKIKHLLQNIIFIHIPNFATISVVKNYRNLSKFSKNNAEILLNFGKYHILSAS